MRASGEDGYSLVLQFRDLENVIKNNFSIISEVQKIGKTYEQTLGVTIGLSYGITSFSNLAQIASDSLKLGINRGGNQAVVKEYGQPAVFYGATTETAVTAYGDEVKFFTSEFIAILKKSKQVYVMGHKFADFDTIGAALGILGISR
jgi:c-di-AMP phosphodiesterase-like protein